MRRLAIGLLAVALLGACGDDGGVTPVLDSGPGTDGGGLPDTGTPDSGGPTCVDEDDDGFGAGCAMGADCDDADPAVSPAATEVCNGVDDNCDGTADEDTGAPSCALTQGVCAGATARCGASGFLECEASDYGPDYEADEVACDGMDNDCDGTTDEGCSCTDGATQACGSDVGICAPGTQTCADSVWGACEGEVAPMGEVCDGADNDCDGMDDEATDLVAPDCALTAGVCAGSVRACGGAAGWTACAGTASYGSDYEETETSCDGLDNDCDGVVDPGCPCVDGATQACGTDVGACMTGIQTCVAGAFGACTGEVATAPETCDGLDNDCDGTVDDGVIAPACALTAGVCAGSTQTCGGTGGFVACTAASYGASYQGTESSCDGLDNDCDGVIDEGCTCVHGTTQPCGTATGACELGTQTCASGSWGACMGGVSAVPETCNGLDDDCNGASDDGLVAPACALTTGVCAMSTQSCGGATGWTACGGTESYGPRYVAAETGDTVESLCDGLDNDCDGTVDDDCITGPLVSGPEDAAMPDLYNRNLVYGQLFSGAWEIMYRNLDRGTARRLTTTTGDEVSPRISGDRVVFLRGTGAATRAVLYDLATDTETVLSGAETSNVDIAGTLVVWDELTGGTQWDVFVRDLSAGGTTINLGSPTTEEFAPAVRGGRIAYVGSSAGGLRVHVRTLDTAGVWSAPVVQTPGVTTGAGHQMPMLDFVMAAWTDGRSITGAATIDSDWDAFYAPFTPVTGLTTFPGENVFAQGAGAEIVRGVDSQIVVFDDRNAGNWNVGVMLVGNTPLTITTSTATQAGISSSGSHLVWQDNRLGSFDIYETFYTGATFLPEAGNVVIAEVLADPAAGADPNGDGAASTTNDEFVELVNTTAIAIDLGGATLSDVTGLRHTFPAGTYLPSFGTIVVFSGGTPTGTFGGARVQVASSGALGLNNAADTLTLTSGATVIDTAAYTSADGADANQSIVRDGATWVQHSMIPGNVGAYSPGVFADGFVP